MIINPSITPLYKWPIFFKFLSNKNNLQTQLNFEDYSTNNRETRNSLYKQNIFTCFSLFFTFEKFNINSMVLFFVLIENVILNIKVKIHNDHIRTIKLEI